MPISRKPGPADNPATLAGPRPLLVPVDFSSCSGAALRCAVKFTACLRSPLLVLHVVCDSPGGLRPAETVAYDMLRDFIGDTLADFPMAAVHPVLQPLLERGAPAGSRILEVARRERATWIFMGSHGRPGQVRDTGESVAAAVVLGSPVPVTIVKASAGMAGCGDDGFRDGWPCAPADARPADSAAMQRAPDVRRGG